MPSPPKVASRLPSALYRAKREVERERRSEGVAGGSSSHDLAVGLDREVRGVVVGTEVGQHLAVVAERRIEIAVLVVARKREVGMPSAAVPDSGRDDSPVGLNGDGTGTVVGTEVGRHPAVTVECRIETAGRVVGASKKDGRAAFARAGHDHLAVCLNRHARGLVVATEVGQYSPGTAERRIEISISGGCGARHQQHQLPNSSRRCTRPYRPAPPTSRRQTGSPPSRPRCSLLRRGYRRDRWHTSDRAPAGRGGTGVSTRGANFVT